MVVGSVGKWDGVVTAQGGVVVEKCIATLIARAFAGKISSEYSPSLAMQGN